MPAGDGDQATSAGDGDQATSAGDGDQATAAGSAPHQRMLTVLSNRRAAVVVYLKGFAMGSAASVPGVSAGTIALIVGIYDRFIQALTRLDGRLVVLAADLHRREGRSQFRAAAGERDLLFLVVLGAGVGTAILTLARLISTTLAAAPGPTFAFFGGLIAASALLLFDPEWLTRPRHIAAASAGFAVAFVVAGASGEGLFPETLPMVFVAGALAITGMVLPGLSGAFILLLLGQFEFLAGVAGRVSDHGAVLATGEWPAELTADGAVILTFVVGAFVGFFTTAHAVRAALDRYPGATFAFLVSLMVGALRYPTIRIVEETEPDPVVVAAVALAAIAGATLVLVFDYYTQDLEYTRAGR